LVIGAASSIRIVSAVIDVGGDGVVDGEVVDEVDQRLDGFADVGGLGGDIELFGIFVEGEVRGVVRGEIVVPDTLLVAGAPPPGREAAMSS